MKLQKLKIKLVKVTKTKSSLSIYASACLALVCSSSHPATDNVQMYKQANLEFSFR
jgi:hypothetical protein